jgi:hypothetical protein
MTGRSLYREEDLQDLWEAQRFERRGLLTEDARAVEIGHPGLRSREGGPDFRGARLRLGGVDVVGDVELHLSPSGWAAHGHDRDGAYAGVVLHVVLRRDRFAEARSTIPVLVLEPYLLATASPESGATEDLDRLGEESFQERRRRMERRRIREGDEEALYRELMVALGYKRNQAAMAELARRAPLAGLPAGAEAAEAALRAAAGGMPAELWRLRGVRPANHPWRRIRGAARFLASARREGLVRGLERRATPEAMAAWLEGEGGEGIGPARAREIAVNVFLPFLGEAAWRGAAGGPPPPLPGALRRGAEGVDTLRRYFGALRRLKRML